jgi:hypothetical protein
MHTFLKGAGFYQKEVVEKQGGICSVPSEMAVKVRTSWPMAFRDLEG